MFDTLLSLDRQALIWMHSLGKEEYSILLQICGEIGVIWAGGALLYLWFSGWKKEENGSKIIALQIFFTITVTYVFYTIVHLFFPAWRSNPQEVVEAIGALIPRPFDNSFPSGHGLFFGALVMSLIRIYPKTVYIIQAILLCTIMGTSRVIVGVHYPLDILGGIVLGGIGAYIVSFWTLSGWFRQYVCAPIIRLARFFRL